MSNSPIYFNTQARLAYDSSLALGVGTVLLRCHLPAVRYEVQHDARPLGIYSIIHPRPLAAGAGSQEASACAGSGGRRMHRRAVQGGGLPSTLARAAHCARQPQDKCCTEVEQRGQQPCWRSLRLRPPRRPYPRPPSCLRRPSFLVEPLQ